MTNAELHSRLSLANPLPAERAADLELDEAQDNLLEGLLASPVPARTARRGTSLRRRPRFARVALPIAATAVVLVALLLLRDGSNDRGSGTAWAAEQVRFAEASPLVLLEAPGWRVTYADEQSRQEGELQFRLGPAPRPQDMVITAERLDAPVPADTRSATLHWSAGGIGSWLKDRAAGAALTGRAPVLGTTAHVYQYKGGTPGHRDITALFRYDGRVLEFRAGAADLDAFSGLLARLKRVDTDTWLAAMPASVIKTVDRDSMIRQMLLGIPLPPGFEPEDIKGAGLTKDRYQLGAAVAGTVTCQWFKHWSYARATNDRAGEREAVAAMATAKKWPVLNEMEEHGGYPSVLYEFAAAMPEGNWYGRPLVGDVESGLSCDSLGVHLPSP